LAEKEVHDCILANIRQEFGTDFYYLCEGFTPSGNPDSKTKIIVDPLDGTVFYARQQSISTLPIGISLAILNGDKYANVIGAAIGDLQSKEIWSTCTDIKTFSNYLGERTANPVHEISHDPVITTDFYFPENAQARLKLRQLYHDNWTRFEAQNPGSTILQLARVAIGEVDAHFQVSPGGPKSWEIAPAYLLITNAGGVVYSLKDLDNPAEFGQVPFSLTGIREPVLAARNEEIAQKILKQLREN
jgi:fructose-1,6-bisphosphatase/inositol monophosphatase family enzyme